MRDAIAELVRDGDTVAIEGFTHLICFAAGHEIIRQGRRDLTLARMTPDLIYDQMVAAGVARKLVFSWLGNPGRGRAPRHPAGDRGRRPRRSPRARGVQPLRHGRAIHGGAMNLPFFPLRSYFETDLPIANPLIRPDPVPVRRRLVYAVPRCEPDVAIVHAQRADAAGDTQIWGLLGCQKEAAFAAERVIVVVEELVDESVIRADPEPDRHPGAHRRRGRRRAARGASVVRAGLLRPRQPLLRGLGRHQPRCRARRVARRVRPRGPRPGRLHGAAGRDEVRARSRPADRRPPAPSTTATTDGDRDRTAARLMILVAGPYRSGTGGDPARIAANVDAMTRAASSCIAAATCRSWASGSRCRSSRRPSAGDWDGDPDADIFHPVAEQVLARCDACLRIGGPSEGADRMVATARSLGKPVFSDLDAVP